MNPLLFFLAMLVASGIGNGAAEAADRPSVRLVIKNHQFLPAQLTVPAGTKIMLIIENQDPSPEEFESYALNREKVIPGGKSARVFIGPLRPGTYKFFGEFHPATAQGEIIATDAKQEDQ